jgi:D-alanyl-D-alanine carboxypeptidase
MTSGLFSYTEDEDFNQTLDTEPQKVWEPEELVEIGFSHSRTSLLAMASITPTRTRCYSG